MFADMQARKEPLILFWLGENEYSGCVPHIEHFPICVSFQFQASSTLAQDSRWSQLLSGSGRSGSSALAREEGAMRGWYLAVPCGSLFALGGGWGVWSLGMWACSLKARLSCSGARLCCWCICVFALSRHSLRRAAEPWSVGTNSAEQTFCGEFSSWGWICL